MREKLPGRAARLLWPLFLSWPLLASQSACVKLPRRAPSVDLSKSAATPPLTTPSAPLINLNTATREELERLPGIGARLAERIIEHREKYGPFRRTEHLLMVRGISERRFQSFSHLLTAE